LISLASIPGVLLPGARWRHSSTGSLRSIVRDAIFTQTSGNELYGSQRSVTTRGWKLVYTGFDFDELYHLADEPLEKVNLARDPALTEGRRELYRRLWEFARETGDNAKNNYIMVGLSEFGPALAFEKSVPTHILPTHANQHPFHHN
jgi:arylsulfatase A-like enzyme